MKQVYFVTLGCPKNTVDSEVMAGHLLKAGYRMVRDPGEYVDLAVVNTCGFIESAKTESIDRILELVQLKEDGRIGRLIVAGCLAQRYAAALEGEIPELDIVMGIDDVESIVELAEGCAVPRRTANPEYIYSHGSPRAVTAGRPFAYLKIADGCNHRCAFCSIPAIRGRQRSRPISDVLEEARELTDAGYRELILVAQDSTAYGRDIGLNDGLSDLLESMARIDGVGWVRPMYFFPGQISDRLLDVMAGHSRITPYIDIPLQHSVKHVLEKMKRPLDGEAYLSLLERIRSRIPGVSIRTSLIVGYPGETDADVDALCGFIRNAAFNHVGVFTYSPEDGTSAEMLGDPVPEPVKESRRSAIMEAQKPISQSLNSELCGRMLDVLVEGYSEETDLLLQGRHRGQAPEIDGVVLINDGVANMGDIVSVEIEEAHIYDVIGKIV